MSEKLVVYHGSYDWFEAPNPQAAKQGDGNSSFGLGFNVTPSVGYTKEHLKNRCDGDMNAIIYSFEIPAENILDLDKGYDRIFIQESIRQAQELGLTELKDQLTRLDWTKDHNTGFTVSDWYKNGSSREFSGDEIKSGVALHLIRKTLGDQRLENEFLKSTGVDAVKHHDVIVVNNYDCLNRMRVHEILGEGPDEMPSGVKPGSFAWQSKRIIFENQKSLWSDQLTSAAFTIKNTGDTELQKAFDRVARALVSDDYIRDPESNQVTAKQTGGYTLRTGVGSAILKALNGSIEDQQEVTQELEKVMFAHNQYFDDDKTFASIRNLAVEMDRYSIKQARTLSEAENILVGQSSLANTDKFGNSAPRVLAEVSASGNKNAMAASQQIYREILNFPMPGKDARAQAEVTKKFSALIANVLKQTMDGKLSVERLNQAIVPIAAQLNNFARGDKYLVESVYQIVNASRKFLSSCKLNPIVVKPGMRSSLAVSPEYLNEASAGDFKFASNIEIPIKGENGWTVMQKDGIQIVKKDGKLQSFISEELGVVAPAVCTANGNCSHVENEFGIQRKTDMKIQEFIESCERAYDGEKLAI